MEMYYKVTIHITGEDYSSDERPRPMVSEVYEGSVEFYHNPSDYGNGYGMYIKMPTEPFGGQGYDIRYDKSFRSDAPIPYIVQFFASRYSGKNGAWQLLGIRVHEADKEVTES